MVKIVDDGIGNLMAMAVGKRDCGRHVLGTAHLGDALDGVGWHGKRSPAMADDPSAGSEAHKKMATLRITGRTQTNGAKGAMTEVIGVFLVGLDVGTERETDVFVICQVTTSEEEARRMYGGDAIGVGEGIEP